MPVERGRGLFRTAIPKIVFHTLMAASVAASLLASAAGQSAVDGAIAGRVISAEGAAIQGAEVVLEGEEGGHRTVTSGRKGEFLIVRLTPGVYQLSSRALGYRGQIEETVTVELGQITEVEVGHVVATHSASTGKHKKEGLTLIPFLSNQKSNQTSNPKGGEKRRPQLAAPTLQARLPQGNPNATVVVSSDLERLPLAGRDWQAVSLEAAGVHADPDADGQSLITVRGLATTQNSSQIDGVSHDQSFGGTPVGAGAGAGREAEDDTEEGGPVRAGGSSGEGIGSGRHAGAAYTFSQSAVREFRLNGQNYSALYGHAAGGVGTATSKSGTNALHGTAFLTIRESSWGASNPFSTQTSYVDGAVSSSVVKPHDLRQQFGGTVGGAALRDRLFYFAAYDEQRRGLGRRAV